MLPSLVGVGIFVNRPNPAGPQSTEPSSSPPSSQPSSPPSPTMPPPLKPYELPDPTGKCHLLDLTDDLLVAVFRQLDLTDLTRSYRLCKTIHNVLTASAAIALRHTLMANGLQLNPHALEANRDDVNMLPQTSASMLTTLRERLQRMRNVTPGSTSTIHLQEVNERLYEYLDGVLLRTIDDNVLRSRHLAVYDLRKAEGGRADTAGEAGPNRGEAAQADGGVGGHTTSDVRSEHHFRFPIAELAVDPGQDLLVLVEVRSTEARFQGRRLYTMHFHILSLSTFGPHPKAEQPVINWPLPLVHPTIHLGFQISDAGLFVLFEKAKNRCDALFGWQWTTGTLCFSLISPSSSHSFLSFVLLSPTSVVIPTVIMHLDIDMGVADQLNNLDDISFSHHLNVFTFPAIGSVVTPEGNEPPAATHVATIDLPEFLCDLEENISPPAMCIRTDPPPRLTFSEFPRHAPPPFQPDPDSGIAVIEFQCDFRLGMGPAAERPHYVMIVPKATLLKHLPPPTKPPRNQVFVKVVLWEELAPDVRVFGPRLDPPNWVCYVYQNRYVTTKEINEDQRELRVYDFDQRRVRKERLAREHARAAGDLSSVEGEVDGVTLVLAESVIETSENQPLKARLTTGANVPYLLVARPTTANIALIDSERVIVMERERLLDDDSDDEDGGDTAANIMEVSHF